MARHLLLTGFGPFLDVEDNPSGALARALDGTMLRTARGAVQVCSRVLAVRYDTAAAETLLAARQLDAIGILGMGVARGATEPRVERTGRAHCDGVTRDAAGQTRTALGFVPELQTPWAEPLATALGAALSDNAGAYVCNAWLYGVLAGLQPPARPLPATFLHVTADGLEPDRLSAALVTWIDGFTP